jgi:hypothetical protein
MKDTRGSPQSTAAERRAVRRSWPVVKTTLTEQPDVLAFSPEKSLRMMWQLATDAWASAGRTLPVYSRANMPVRRLRSADIADGPA